MPRAVLLSPFRMWQKMSLAVLSVGYPFATLSTGSVGGAEQVLSRLDHALVEAGHRSIVIAPRGSKCSGELIAGPSINQIIDSDFRQCIYAALRRIISQAVKEFRPDLVHLHGVDFYEYMPPPGCPVLVTLHLPLAWYPANALKRSRPNTWLLPVSRDQASRAPAGVDLLPEIENGIEIGQFGRGGHKRPFVLALGRICPEKGFHLALDAAKEAGVRCLLAGSVSRYPEHLAYFDSKIRPRLDHRLRWIGPVGGQRKRRLLARARCVLVPSLVVETSSLVAREALAAGTPVIAFRAGALCEIIDNGRTGYLVDTVEEMAKAISMVDQIDAQACRDIARHRFAAAPMIDRYFRLYRALAQNGAAEFQETDVLNSRYA